MEHCNTHFIFAHDVYAMYHVYGFMVVVWLDGRSVDMEINFVFVSNYCFLSLFFNLFECVRVRSVERTNKNESSKSSFVGPR